MKPFSIDILNTTVEKLLDLFTGQVVLVEKCDYADKSRYKFIDDYEKNVYNSGLGMYLVFIKLMASSILCHSTGIH